MREFDLPRGTGVLHAYDTGATGRADELVVFWHGGTPNTGLPPEPLFADAERLGVRFIGADRPGYGGSTADPDRPLASVAGDVAAVADHLGAGRFATLGHSGGGPRAVATAALLPERVIAAVAVSSPAPADAGGLDRFAGMADGIVAEQRAAQQGRSALTAELERGGFDESCFTGEDYAALEGEWAWFMPVVQAATADGLGGQVEDTLQQAAPWGFDPVDVRVPVLIVHGAGDRMVPAAHGAWLARAVPGAEHREVPGAGHVSVLAAAPAALEWLRERSAR